MKKRVIDEGFLALLESRDLEIHRKMEGLFGGNRPSAFYGSSLEFADYREYLQGDDPRRIDRHLLARFDKLFIKQFVDERRLHHRIYIDASRSMDWGKPGKDETALKLAAALGYLAVQNCDRVSFYALRNGDCTEIAASVSSKDAFYQSAALLNSVKFYGEFHPKGAVAAREDSGKNDGLAIVISDCLNDGWQDVLEELVLLKKQVQLLQVLSRDEADPEIFGKVFLLDRESDDEEDERNFKRRINRGQLKAYAKAFAYHQGLIKEFCAARGIGFLSVLTDEAIEKILFLKATEGGLIK
jgi:uncharacterized protein (DUF58 family)